MDKNITHDGGHAQKLHDELVALSSLTRELKTDEN